MKTIKSRTKTEDTRIGEGLLEDELAPAVIGGVSRPLRDKDGDLDMLTGNTVTGTVESFTALQQRGTA